MLIMNKCIPAIARKDCEVRNRTGLKEPGASWWQAFLRRWHWAESGDPWGESGLPSKCPLCTSAPTRSEHSALTRPSPSLCFSGSPFRKQKNKWTRCAKKGRPIRPWWGAPGRVCYQTGHVVTAEQTVLISLGCDGVDALPAALRDFHILCAHMSSHGCAGQGRPFALETEKGEEAVCEPEETLHSWP